MMQGPIRRIARERLEDRSDARLPMAWVHTGTAVDVLPDGLAWFYRDRAPVRVDVVEGAPALVMLASDHGQAQDALAAHAEAGARVYVLVPNDWKPTPAANRWLSSRTVLIRKVPEVPVSGVHSATDARIWVGAEPGAAAPWALRLTGKQTEAFRQVFLRLFWHHATEEAWTGGKALSFRPALERPFDVPEQHPSSPVRLLAASDDTEIENRGALVHVVSGPPPSETPRGLWIPAASDHQERLAQLVRSGCDVRWNDRDLPDMAVGRDGGALLASGQLNRLRVELTKAQAADAARVLECAAPWNLRLDVVIGNAELADGRFWLPGAPAALPLEREQVIGLPDVQATDLRPMPDSAPESWPAAQPLALGVRYRWTVLAPRLPSGAEEDQLLGKWRKIDEGWKQRLAKVSDAAQAAESHRGRIGKAFASLVSAALGFERTQRGLMKEVARLQAQMPSQAGPDRAPELLTLLAQLEQQALKLQGDLDEAERKAREDEERKKQAATWQGRVDAAARDLPGRREALEAAEARQPKLSEELVEVNTALKSAKKDQKKDLEAKRHKLSDDQARLTKDVNRLRSEVAELLRQSKESFVFKSLPVAQPNVQQSTTRFVPAPATGGASIAVPDEALPEVGLLRSHRGQRYLVIEQWDMLDAGEQAARRLKARLVASEKT